MKGKTALVTGVAGDDRSVCPALIADGSHRFARSFEVQQDTRMVFIQLARRWIMAITFLGDGHGDDSRPPVGDQGWADRPIITGKDDIPQRADDLDILFVVVAGGECVEKILRLESISDGWAAKADPANSPRRIPRDRIAGRRL